MSAKRPASKRPSSPEKPQPHFPPSLRPRRWLAILLGILVVAWLLFLLILRIKTVHP